MIYILDLVLSCDIINVILTITPLQLLAATALIAVAVYGIDRARRTVRIYTLSDGAKLKFLGFSKVNYTGEGLEVKIPERFLCNSFTKVFTLLFDEDFCVTTDFTKISIELGKSSVTALVDEIIQVQG